MTDEAAPDACHEPSCTVPTLRESERLEAWKAEFEFTTKVVFTFYDWRHKILVRYALVVAALGVSIQYLYERRFPLLVQEAPIAAGVFFSAYFVLTDRVHKRILDDCYAVGVALEKSAGIKAGLLSKMQTRVKPSKAKKWRDRISHGLLSYRLLLRVLFGAGAASFAAVGAALAWAARN